MTPSLIVRHKLCHHPLHRHEARAFHEHMRVRGQSRFYRERKCIDLLIVFAAFAKYGHGIAHEVAGGTERLDTCIAGECGDFGVHGGSFVPEFTHISQHENAWRWQFGEHSDGGFD